jgi:hypothetical protein
MIQNDLEAPKFMNSTLPTNTNETEKKEVKKEEDLNNLDVIKAKNKQINEDLILRPKVEKKKLLVQSTVFSTLDQYREEILNINNQSENFPKFGIIFGYESNNSIEVSNLKPINSLVWEDFNNELNMLKNRLEKSRMDFSPIGIYYISQNSSISKALLKLLLKIKAYHPQSVLLYYDPLLNKTSFKKLTKEVTELSLQAEMKNYKDYEIDLFNSEFTSNIFEELPYSTIQDLCSLLSGMNQNYVNNEENYNTSYLKKFSYDNVIELSDERHNTNKVKVLKL